MKKKFIKEPVYESYFWLVWDCDIHQLKEWILKHYKWEMEIRQGFQHMGKTITIETDKHISWIIWINDRKNFETLSHELFHMTRQTLQTLGIPLNEDTDEVYAYLFSCYIRESLKALKK